MVRVLRRVPRGAQRDWMPGDILEDGEAKVARNFRTLVQAGYLKPEPKRASTPPPKSYTVAELRQVAPTLDRTALQGLLRAERGGKARKTALAVLEAALEAT